nr:MAG TPA: hypothetical protein [Bacteriophage sp.]
MHGCFHNFSAINAQFSRGISPQNIKFLLIFALFL